MYQRWKRRRWKHHSPSTRTYESQYCSMPTSHSWVAGRSSSSRQYTIPCAWSASSKSMMWFPMKWIDVRIRRIVFVNHPFSASRPVASRPTCTSGTKRSTRASMSLESSASAYRYGSCRIAACDSMRSRRSSTVAGVQVPSRDTVNAPLVRLGRLGRCRCARRRSTRASRGRTARWRRIGCTSRAPLRCRRR